MQRQASVGFEQAAIRIEKEKEFEELTDAFSRALGADKVEKFLKRVRRSSSRVRDVEAVLAKGVLEQVDEVLAKSGKTARALYTSLTVSDQAQMREFYLSRIEEVDPKLRTKFRKLYRYY
jgi:hypothetical protein